MKRNEHLLIDDRKLWGAQAVLEIADLPTVRAISLANLERWKAMGTWGLVYEQWRQIMTEATDDELIHIMTGSGDEPNRLRQSPPYVGILDEGARLKIYARYEQARVANKIAEPQTLGQIMKTRRRGLGLTQQQLADLCHVSRRVVRKVEVSTVGNLDTKLFDRIANVLGLNVDGSRRASWQTGKGLSIAANISNIYCSTQISEDQLRETLFCGEMTSGIDANLRFFLDEVPAQIVVIAVEETALDESIHPSRIWANLKKISGQLNLKKIFLRA